MENFESLLWKLVGQMHYFVLLVPFVIWPIKLIPDEVDIVFTFL